MKTEERPGNAGKNAAQNAAVNENSPLKGKRIIFLGSSVTYGSAAEGESFAEFLEKKDGVIPVKEAVPGTTLVDNGEQSYISRMKRLPAEISADVFICQLSTNDASLGLPLGEISPSFAEDAFDTSTVAGAIETIIVYVRKTWSCPVIFYTGTRYDSPRYGEMVALLRRIAEKHQIGVIDLWNSPINDVSPELYSLYMADGIHPTKAGYGEWWLPEIEKYLLTYLK